MSADPCHRTAAGLQPARPTPRPGYPEDDGAKAVRHPRRRCCPIAACSSIQESKFIGPRPAARARTARWAAGTLCLIGAQSAMPVFPAVAGTHRPRRAQPRRPPAEALAPNQAGTSARRIRDCLSRSVLAAADQLERLHDEFRSRRDAAVPSLMLVGRLAALALRARSALSYGKNSSRMQSNFRSEIRGSAGRRRWMAWAEQFRVASRVGEARALTQA